MPLGIIYFSVSLHWLVSSQSYGIQMMLCKKLASLIVFLAVRTGLFVVSNQGSLIALFNATWLQR